MSPIVKYTGEQGEQRTFRPRGSATRALIPSVIGETVDLLYDETNPVDVRLASVWDLYLLPIMFGGIAALLFCWGARVASSASAASTVPSGLALAAALKISHNDSAGGCWGEGCFGMVPVSVGRPETRHRLGVASYIRCKMMKPRSRSLAVATVECIFRADSEFQWNQIAHTAFRQRAQRNGHRATERRAMRSMENFNE